MSRNVGDLFAIMRLEDREYRSKLAKNKKESLRFGDALQRRFDRIDLKRAAFAFAGLATTIGYASVKMVNIASDAEEIQSKFNTVFRNLAEQANQWSEDFGSSVGRARQDVKAWMAGLQDTFVPLGFARDRAYELSKSLTTLAVDVASFNNQADADVIRDFTSALVGNHETVRKYGIIITENALKLEALKSGWNKSYKSMTELEKVQLRYNMIMAGTTDAQGDAIRTGGSYANQMKRLRANIKDISETLGQSLLPIFNEIVTATNKWLKETDYRRWAKDVLFWTKAVQLQTEQTIKTFVMGAEMAKIWVEGAKKFWSGRFIGAMKEFGKMTDIFRESREEMKINMGEFEIWAEKWAAGWKKVAGAMTGADGAGGADGKSPVQKLKEDVEKFRSSVSRRPLELPHVKMAKTPLPSKEYFEFLTQPRTLAAKWEAAMIVFQEQTATLQDHFVSLAHNISYSWASTIEGMISGSIEFRDFAKRMFQDVLGSYLSMISQMAAEKLFAATIGQAGLLGGLFQRAPSIGEMGDFPAPTGPALAGAGGISIGNLTITGPDADRIIEIVNTNVKRKGVLRV